MRPVKKRLWIVKKRQTVRVRAQRREIPGKKSSLGTLYHLMAQVWRILYSQQQRQQKEPQELGGLKITPTGALQHYKTALKRSLVNILTTVVTQHVTLSAFHFSLPTKNIMGLFFNESWPTETGDDKTRRKRIVFSKLTSWRAYSTSFSL